MASRTSQAMLEGLEPKENFETFVIVVPKPGNPPILTHSGEEADATVLKIIKANKYLADRANDLSSKATNFVSALRGLANLLNLKRNQCEETGLHLANIERLVRIAENDVDLGYHISRVRLLKFDAEQHAQAETDLAAAEAEIVTLKEEVHEAVKALSNLQATRKVIRDCIRAGHDILAFF